MTLLTAEGLGVTYPGAAAPALADVSLTLAAGERLALIGESGSGKSTLARAVAGLLPRGSRVEGRIGWPGWAAPPRPGRDIGYVFQDPRGSLNPLLSIGAHLEEVLRAHRPMSRSMAAGRAADLLARVRIPDPRAALARYPHQFSGGQCQRIAIALAIAGEPRLLIADEATSALDMLVQAEIVALIRDLVEEAGMALMFITHDMALAGTLADRIAVLHRGRIVEEGPAPSLLAAPRADYTRRLLAARLDLSSPRLVGVEAAR